MPNNVMLTASQQARQAKRFASVTAHRRGGLVSPRTLRAFAALVVVALLGAVGYVSLTLYAKQAAAAARAAAAGVAPAMGQWAMVRDEEVVVPQPKERGLRADAGGGKVVTTVVPRRKRRIVLSTGKGMWNTGVWPNWGQGTDTVTLNWAAAGVVVKKSCSTECVISHDQAGADAADAIVMEAINHPKFLGTAGDAIPLPWPALRDNLKRQLPGPAPTAIPATLPLTALFYYEAAQTYPKYTLATPEFAARFDFTMTPDQDSTLPVTLVCPWGRETVSFLASPADVAQRKAPGRLIAYFNEHGVAPAYAAFVDELFAAAGGRVHAYQNRKNTEVPQEFGACVRGRVRACVLGVRLTGKGYGKVGGRGVPLTNMPSLLLHASRFPHALPQHHYPLCACSEAAVPAV